MIPTSALGGEFRVWNADEPLDFLSRVAELAENVPET